MKCESMEACRSHTRIHGHGRVATREHDGPCTNPFVLGSPAGAGFPPRIMRPRRTTVDSLSEFRLRIGLAACALIPPLTGVRCRRMILTALGIEIGRGTTFGGRVRIEGSSRPGHLLAVGADCWINTGVLFDLGARIAIGDRVSIAHDVSLLTTLRHTGSSRRAVGDERALPVVIGDGCWLGARSTILPGVTVGAGSIVAAGAVVTHDVAPNTLVAGLPARSLRDLP